MEEIIKRSKIEKMQFKPSFFFSLNPLQLINLKFSKRQSKCKLVSFRETVNENGVQLIWVEKEDKKIEEENKGDGKKAVVILPGLTGSLEDEYIYNLCAELIEKTDFIPIVYQMRILNDKFNLKETSPEFFLIKDVDEALNYVLKKLGSKTKIFAVGFSYGANQLVRYLGEFNVEKKKINAAVSISNPYDFVINSKLTINKLYCRMLLTFLQKVIRKTKETLLKFNKLKIPVNDLLNLRNIYNFDELYTSKIFGFSSADDYYRNVSCAPFVPKVDVPLLCFHSKDDQICVEAAIPKEAMKSNEKIALVLTEKGAHSCFLEDDGWNIFGVRQWVDGPAVEFLRSVETVEG